MINSTTGIITNICGDISKSDANYDQYNDLPATSTYLMGAQHYSSNSNLQATHKYPLYLYANPIAYCEVTDSVYIGSVYKVKVVDLKTTTAKTIAGNNAAGCVGDGFRAAIAQFGYVSGLAVDSVGNLYIADYVYDTIRVIDYTTGIINTIAGTSTCTSGLTWNIKDENERLLPTAVPQCISSLPTAAIDGEILYGQCSDARQIKPSGSANTVLSSYYHGSNGVTLSYWGNVFPLNEMQTSTNAYWIIGVRREGYLLMTVIKITVVGDSAFVCGLGEVGGANFPPFGTGGLGMFVLLNVSIFALTILQQPLIHALFVYVVFPPPK